MDKRKLWSRAKLLVLSALLPVMLAGCDNKFIVLDAKGPVAETQQKLIILTMVLCAVVVIPVIILLWWIVAKYRDKPDNKAPYEPEWNDSKVLETIWWGIPIIVIIVLGYFTARDTIALAKPPVSDTKPINIQVTSLDWKWLFQYPDQGIATVNYIEIPAGVPVHFQLTSDAPMNSFWIPQLGGQVYTMPGMAMGLYLQADEPGEYFGSGANFSGKDFAHMRFQVVSKPQADFNKWVEEVKANGNALTMEGYNELMKPGTSEKTLFASYPKELFDHVVEKNGGGYMEHGGNPHKKQQENYQYESKTGVQSSEGKSTEHSNH